MQQPVAKSNNGIIDALSDVFHGSLLEKIPARSLIIISIVSKKLNLLFITNGSVKHPNFLQICLKLCLQIC